MTGTLNTATTPWCVETWAGSLNEIRKWIFVGNGLSPLAEEIYNKHCPLK